MTPKSQLSASHPHTTQKTMIPASVLLTQRLLPLQEDFPSCFPWNAVMRILSSLWTFVTAFSLPADQTLIHFSLGKILI